MGWVIPTLSKRGFFKGLEEVKLFLGWGLTQRVCFLGDMGGRSLVVSNCRKRDFSFSFCGVGWGD